MATTSQSSPSRSVSRSPERDPKGRNFVLGMLDSLLEKKNDKLTGDVSFVNNKNKIALSANSSPVNRSIPPAIRTATPVPNKPSGLISGPTPVPAMCSDLHVGKYTIKKELGSGTFGKVKLGEDPITKELVAIKVIDKANIQNPKQKTSVDREIRLMKLLRHPCIVGVNDVLESASHYYVIMEHASGGELFDYIIKKGSLKEKEARTFFQQIVSAVEYCHKNSVIHRDLKPENLLLDNKNNLKLIDFGFGNTFHKDRLLDTYCGSPFYAAPEMIQGIRYTGPEVDVWSMGVILFALLSGRLPFDAKTMGDLYKKIAKGLFRCPSIIPPEARKLIQRMLTVDRATRATLDEVRDHPWTTDSGAQPMTPYALNRPKIVTEPNQESINELKTYGFLEQDARRMLAQDLGAHPIVSLYHLIDEARMRREEAWKEECKRIEDDNRRFEKSQVQQDSWNVTQSFVRPSIDSFDVTADLSGLKIAVPAATHPHSRVVKPCPVVAKAVDSRAGFVPAQSLPSTQLSETEASMPTPSKDHTEITVEQTSSPSEEQNGIMGFFSRNSEGRKWSK